MSAPRPDPRVHRLASPLAPSRQRFDLDGVVGVACALMLPLALLFV